MTETETSTGRTSVEWLYGAQCARFTVHVQLGRGGIHKVSVDVTTDGLRKAAKILRERPECTAFPYYGGIRRGQRGWQSVPVHVPRGMLTGIADALDGSVDADDAAHRFWHWERPSVQRPCSSCRETLNAHDAAVEAARAHLLEMWSATLSVPTKTIEQLLREFGDLPKKALR